MSHSRILFGSDGLVYTFRGEAIPNGGPPQLEGG